MFNKSGGINFGGARPKIPGKKCSNDYSDFSHHASLINQVQIDDKPLESKEITTFVNGRQMRKNALHPDWADHRIFMECSHPHFLADNILASGGIETWLEEISFLCSDLEWLLSLSHHKFWSQIVYDCGVHNCLDAFLSCRIRWFDGLAYNDEMLLAAERADQLVFLVYLRMATHKESKTEYISPKCFGDLVYDNYIFDCCKFLDLCVLYGHSNKKLLNKMIHKVFSNQPKYNNDLRMLVSSLKNVLSNIEKELCIFPDKIPIPLKKLTDVIIFMVDNLFSVFSFLKVYPEASFLFHKEQYIERLAIFYEAAIPFISENLSCHSQAGEDVGEFKNKFEMGRTTALSLFREILNNLCIDELRSNNLSMEKLEECITIFISISTTVAEEKIFTADYDSMCGFADNLKLFEKAGADVTTLSYIKETISRSVSEAMSTYGSLTDYPVMESTKSQAEHIDDTSGMNGYYNANQQEFSDFNVLSLISSVKDLLPDLGTGFIKECLKYYSYSVEDTLNAIFECNLPPSLDCIDRTTNEDIIPENKPSKELDKIELSGVATTSMLDDRRNVYNGDEFDTFSSKETLKKVRTGKKTTTLMPPDEQLMVKLKEIGREYDNNAGYSIYEDELKYTPIHSADYEDEYDDSYDGGCKASSFDVKMGASIFGKGALNVKGIDFDATPSDSEHETETASSNGPSSSHVFKRPINKGPFNKKSNGGKFRQGTQNSTKPQPEAGEVEKDEKFNRQSKNVDFCENPEDVRKRAEERKRSKMATNRRYGKVGEQQYHMPQPDIKPKPESTKNSGKPLRPDTENGGDKGGNKKDTGEKKENLYRKKTIHKNEHKRFGAQAKQRGRF